MKKQTGFFPEWLIENGSYKLVALFVTLILWVTILGRRDTVLSKELEIEFLLPQNMIILGNSARKVEVKISGPSSALKKFAQNTGNITIDLTKGQPGVNRAVLSGRNVEVPFGAKVISVSPEEVIVNLVPGRDKKE